MIASKYLVLIGAGAALLLFFSVLGYGRYENSLGYDRRDAEVQVEVAKRNTETFKEQQRLQAEANAVEQKYVDLKKTSDVQLAAAGSVAERLRKQTDNAIRERNAAIASSRAYAAGADWVGGFAACYAEYGSLGKDYARTADKLRGLQLFEHSQGTVKTVPAAAK